MKSLINDLISSYENKDYTRFEALVEDSARLSPEDSLELMDILQSAREDVYRVYIDVCRDKAAEY